MTEQVAERDAAIRVRGVSKSYRDVTVLREVDLRVDRGRIVALLGANGAGKTTLVRILATLTRADGGEAMVAGFDVADDAARVREAISLTGQFAAVDEVLTGRENLVLIARLRHVPHPTDAARTLLERFSLLDAADRKAGTYSGGMRRRLDIAMSLIGDPEVVFFDEPTTGLDPQARIEVWDAISRLAGSGVSVLLTTQYLDEAEHLADRIAILHHGRIIADDTFDNLKQVLPATTVEYVEKQPTLEDVFFALTREAGADDSASHTKGHIR
ncbi:ABC transporter ATP-binding protein [Williamsia sterculiae]|nr:ABC transporter ATP-binding protein [Williamsia sterculiae]